ncbi:Chromatin structure-remodeling complex subunit rsc9 [Pseudocercospora fuligena]|uniref:Chromatin structure-remodeling complex subunit rsc9 n=1 Tax=Pseudocercospora fuligena TaxID=685502 RepID=A0A8H6VGD3_9PEZI|nr:Chromatin structure-remodeling complex subunit rsc9 [Pseudocercospora fuligena]
MAPKRGQSIERTDEHDEFMKRLEEYHEKRGTLLDPEPKVGIRHVDLFKLYNRVVEEGGYDLCSDTKAKPLMWRRLAEEFIGKNQYTAAQAFQIKNVYYKNLCAYEISTHWKQEPPPKEILEDVTAKGGNVMTRTLENFERPKPREELNGDGSDASPEQKTPKEVKPEIMEEPGSATGRSTRGLRQQPPQRVLFQPEVGSSRQTRGQNHVSHNSPTPGAMNGVVNASSLTNGTSSTLASYEPSQAYPLSLKPVITPANNPEFYRNERKRKLEATAGPLAKKYKNIMLPGTGFIGPNIYVRAQLALQSGIPDEEQYALHHLVKISHERGDKYRFDQFPGLADALVKKGLQVTSLFYDIDWDVMYDEEFFAGDDETLNGLDGTPDILQKLKSRIPIISDDSVLDFEFIAQMNRITESALVMRNMALQEENAAYLSRLPLVQDLIAVVLNLPEHASITEMRHYVLDVAEQVLKYIDIGSQDAAYQGLLQQVLRSDRGSIATALRTLSRIAMTHPAPKRLDDVPGAVLRATQQYLLIDDEELRSAALDFLGQFTSIGDNVEVLLRAVDAEALGRQLSRLVLFNAKEYREQRPPRRREVEDTIPPVPRLSKSLVESLLKLEEPERSSEWLRMCFVADSNAEMTQISLWQAYQGTFAPYHATHPHLIAGDFIKNVSTTFPGATAQVAGSNKYVIKGIRSRKVPVDTGILAGSKGTDKGKELLRCHWKMTIPVEGTRDPVTGLTSAPTTREAECAEWFRSGDDILRHILTHHLQIPRKDVTGNVDKMDVDSMTPARSTSTPVNGLTNGAGSKASADLDFRSADKTTYRCRWADCQRLSTEFTGGDVPRTQLFARHVETHLPDPDSSRARHNLKLDAVPTHTDYGITRLSLLEDEKGDAAGVPLRAALVLRNMARFMPKDLAPAQSLNALKRGEKKEEITDIMTKVFDSEVKERLFYAMSHSKTIRDYVGAVFRAVKQNSA